MNIKYNTVLTQILRFFTVYIICQLISCLFTQQSLFIFVSQYNCMHFISSKYCISACFYLVVCINCFNTYDPFVRQSDDQRPRVESRNQYIIWLFAHHYNLVFCMCFSLIELIGNSFKNFIIKVMNYRMRILFYGARMSFW